VVMKALNAGIITSTENNQASLPTIEDPKSDRRDGFQ